MLLCDVSDLYAHGLPRGAVANPGRSVVSVDTTADTLAIADHGLAEGDPLTLRAEVGGSMPAGLTAGTTYYALPVTAGTFSVSATPGGAAVNITTAGARVVCVTPLPTEAAIEWASREIENLLPAHVVPLEAPVPDIIRMTCAELAAWKVLAIMGAAPKALLEVYDGAQRRLARWARGVPVRGADVPAHAGLSMSAAPREDARGWGRYGGI